MWHDGALKANNINVFFSANLFPILKVTFTINIDLESDENVAEKLGLEANKQTRIYREFSWQQH